MSVFGGVAIHMHLIQKLPLESILSQKGAEGVMYYVLSQFPLANIVIPIFLIILFVSYVAGAAANTFAMSALSTKGVDLENPDPPASIKITWGVVIALLSIAMLLTQGLEGVRTMSILGGFPALIFEWACAGVLSYRVWGSIKISLRNVSVGEFFRWKTSNASQ